MLMYRNSLEAYTGKMMKNAADKQIQGNQLSLAILAVIMTLTAIVLWISISGQPWPTWLLALAAVL